MSRKAFKDPATGLFPIEEAFARYCLRHTQTDAFRLSHEPKYINALSSETITQRACKMAAKPEVKARVRALLDESKIQDLESVGSAYQQLCDLLDKAKDAKNWTACAAFMRLKLQVLGMLKETVLLNMEQTISDDELVKRVAGKNPLLATALRNNLGKEDSYAA